MSVRLRHATTSACPSPRDDRAPAPAPAPASLLASATIPPPCEAPTFVTLGSPTESAAPSRASRARSRGPPPPRYEDWRYEDRSRVEDRRDPYFDRPPPPRRDDYYAERAPPPPRDYDDRYDRAPPSRDEYRERDYYGDRGAPPPARYEERGAPPPREERGAPPPRYDDRYR